MECHERDRSAGTAALAESGGASSSQDASRRVSERKHLGNSFAEPRRASSRLGEQVVDRGSGARGFLEKKPLACSRAGTVH